MVKCPQFKTTKKCSIVLPIKEMAIHESTCRMVVTTSTKQSREDKDSGSSCKESRQPDQSTTCPSCGELLDEDAAERARTAAARGHNLICPNAQVACPLASAGCTDLITRSSLPDHIQNSSTRHIQLLFEWLLKIQQIQSSQVKYHINYLSM